MNETPGKSSETILKTKTPETTQDTNYSEFSSKLFEIKKSELKDGINTFFDNLNNKIKSMNPREISQYFDEQMSEFLDFQSEKFKQLPDSVSLEIISLTQLLGNDLKNKSLDGNLSIQERQELIDSIFNHSNQLTNKILQETNVY